jgi:hypothetical protein
LKKEGAEEITVVFRDGSRQEETRHVVRNGENLINLDQNARMASILRRMPLAALLLAGRNWSFLRLPENSKGFLCSDNPVGIFWQNSSGKGPLAPCLADPDSIVFFPLNRHCGIWGICEDADPKITLDREGVALFNTFIVHNKTRFVYSHSDETEIVFKDGSIGTLAKSFEEWKDVPQG